MEPQMANPLMSGLTPQTMQIVVFLLVSISVGAVLLAYWLRRPDVTRLEHRIEQVAGAAASRDGTPDLKSSRRRQVVEETLRELDAKDQARSGRNARPTLTKRMRQAGLSWSRYTYFVVSAMVGIAVCLLTLSVFRLGYIPSLGFGAAAGLLLPHLYVSRQRNSRLNRFGLEFPNALDIVVRGVKAGLPLVDCLKIIAAEAQEPVRSEFRGIIHDQTLGVPLDDAVERLAERVPLPETNFFAIVLAIQSRTGGNLSEALGNLSKVLRDRKNLRAKVKALSAEAKSSAGIIGAMPLVVAAALYFTAPDYITLLFTTPTGNITLVACAVWMLAGSLIMRQMINFDF